MNIKISKLDIELAIKANYEDFLEKNGTSVIVPLNFSEVDIFTLLLEKFGSPNGPMTFSIPQGDPDAPFKWDFIFSFKNIGTIHILRNWKNLEIIFKKEKIDKNELLEFLKFNLDRYQDVIKTKKEELENYILLINPYKRHKKIAENAQKNLLEVTINKPHYPKNLIDSDNSTVKIYTDSFLKYINSVEDETSYSIVLLTHSVYMIESYINLIIAVFLKQEIKSDKQTHKETIERKWKDKIRRLHLDCSHINQVNMRDPMIVKINDIFQLRNKIAHSYPDIENLKITSMWFYKNFPIFKNPEPFDLYQIPSSNRAPTRIDAENAYKIAEDTIAFLDEFIDKKVIKNFKFFVDSDPIGFNKKKNVYSVPFSPTVITFFGGSDQAT